MATPTMTLASTESLTVRCRNSRSGMIGSAARCSTSRAQIPSSTAPTSMTALCQLSQWYCWPARLTQMSSRLTAAVISVAPA
jgi:hypothetical protein